MRPEDPDTSPCRPRAAAYRVEMAGDVANISVLKACKVLRAFTPTVGVLSVAKSLPGRRSHVAPPTSCAGPWSPKGCSKIQATAINWVPCCLNWLVRSSNAPACSVPPKAYSTVWCAPRNKSAPGPTHPRLGGLPRPNSSTRHVAMFNRVGQRAPAHLTGCGKAALTWLPFDKVVEHVERCCAESAFPYPISRSSRPNWAWPAERLHHLTVVSEGPDVGRSGHFGRLRPPTGGRLSGRSGQHVHLGGTRVHAFVGHRCCESNQRSHDRWLAAAATRHALISVDAEIGVRLLRTRRSDGRASRRCGGGDLAVEFLF